MVKLKDVADKAGVNVSTVSRALMGKSDIGPETRKRIVKIAEDLGYKTKRMKSDCIGVLVPEIVAHHYAELVQVLEKNLRDRGYSMICKLTGFDADRVGDAVESMYGFGVAGIILCDLASDDSKRTGHEAIVKPGMPVVVLSEVRSLSHVDCIYIDQSRIISLAVEHLTELGHTKLGYIGELNSEIRHRAFIELLKSKSLQVDERFIKIGKERFERGGYLRANELLREPELPTAVLACYDQVAVGAMKAFSEVGILVPEQISVIGINNIVESDYLHTRLTSITNPVEQQGIVAVKLLLAQIQDSASHIVQHVALQSTLVARDSTAPPICENFRNPLISKTF